MKQNKKLIWVDLETTGFDSDFNMKGCQIHKILEIGIHITDEKFNIIDQGLNIVIQQNEKELNRLSCNIVKKLHSESGLFKEVVLSTTTLEEAEFMIIEYLVIHGVEKGVSPICGNNVSFDKNFIDAQMPNLKNWFHYRKIDVSSFKEVFRLSGLNIEKMLNKNMKHRAIDDIGESIDEMKKYLTFFNINAKN